MTSQRPAPGPVDIEAEQQDARALLDREQAHRDDALRQLRRPAAWVWAQSWPHRRRARRWLWRQLSAGAGRLRQRLEELTGRSLR